MASNAMADYLIIVVQSSVSFVVGRRKACYRVSDWVARPGTVNRRSGSGWSKKLEVKQILQWGRFAKSDENNVQPRQIRLKLKSPAGFEQGVRSATYWCFYID